MLPLVEPEPLIPELEPDVEPVLVSVIPDLLALQAVIRLPLTRAEAKRRVQGAKGFFFIAGSGE